MFGNRPAAVVALGVMLASAFAGASAQGGGMMGAGGPGMMDSATSAQMMVMHDLVVNHDRISRTVTKLPDGVRTVTESKDPRLARLIKDHVVTMDQRIRTSNDPGMPMESPSVRAIFRGHDRIRTTVDTTATGVVVVQTSADTALVTALQQHAAEVTDLVDRGMAAMHDAMMKPAAAGRGGGPPAR